jgi:D-alanyl-D-alanine carboxypeptidase
MLEDAKKDNINLKIISAFRSFQYQKNLKQRNIILYGKTNADRLVANQGLSEHQLGTTIDFINSKTGHMNGFEKTEAYE